MPMSDSLICERESTHGDFTEQAALAQRLKATMAEGRNWPGLSPMQREAIEQIAVKISRILSGNPTHPDHWMDIAGYAALAIA